MKFQSFGPSSCESSFGSCLCFYDGVPALEPFAALEGFSTGGAATGVGRGLAPLFFGSLLVAAAARA